MAVRLGLIEYERPSRYVTAEDVRHLLSVGGKDVIRIAWSSLNPDRKDRIKKEAFAVWLCEFFNMKRNDGQGTKCINILDGMDLIGVGDFTVWPKFDL